MISTDGRGTASRLATEFGISRQVANGYLQAMARAGLINAEGTTRARVYELETLDTSHGTFARGGLEEDVVCRNLILPKIADLPGNVRDIWQYASTEMINNAIDHSDAVRVTVLLRRNALFSEVLVSDDGEGIFRKIQRALDLHDPRESILELAKGKLTTAPERHSGEGIFFTSRVMDLFEIDSHHLRFSHTPRATDTIGEHPADTPGTRVRMRLENDSPRRLSEVFEDFMDSEDLSFDRTVVPLRMAQHEGEKLVSRSQAKRVAHRFDKFKRVELDFMGVEAIGQGFADEMFRVFANAHPEIRIVPTNTSPGVAKMIRHVLGPSEDGEKGQGQLRTY